MSLEFPGIISLQIQVTTKDFESLNPLLNYTFKCCWLSKDITKVHPCHVKTATLEPDENL